MIWKNQIHVPNHQTDKACFLGVFGEAISERARTSALWTYDLTEIFYRFNAGNCPAL
jgi:hypothetical protein